MRLKLSLFWPLRYKNTERNTIFVAAFEISSLKRVKKGKKTIGTQEDYFTDFNTIL